MDYEYQPANHVAFRFANRVLVPEDFPDRRLRMAGARRAKVWRYRGFKEEVYLHAFQPDPGVLAELGLERGEPFFVARPSPAGAAYHQFENPVFDRALAQALGREDARVVLLPRRPEDVRTFEGIPASRQIVPPRAIDTLSLLHYAAALLGAGGTMNREAALLGTPVYGLYAGRLAALDQRLIREGRLRALPDSPARFEAELVALAAGRSREDVGVGSAVLERFLDAILTLAPAHRPTALPAVERGAEAVASR
jgi:predicted glycosyltransferase